MKATSIKQTKALIEFVVKTQTEVVRDRLHERLVQIGSKEGQFIAGIIEHQDRLKLTEEQWFVLNCKLRNRVLRSGLDLSRILSEEHLRLLPPVTG